ncbi:MAG: hypothetical protein L7S46_00830 [Candidatus Poseidoniaceae archaeon]|nr:hypothetical protein [Candidatus Poseidoniaceae archaeon]
MEEPAWWPSGIAQHSMEEAQCAGEVRTSFGRAQMWNLSNVMSADWWNTPPGNGVLWGSWPDSVEQVRLLSEDEFGMLLNLDDRFIARVCPFLVGEDVSRMARFEPWATCVNGLALLLPNGGWNAGAHDRILLYDAYIPDASFPDSIDGLIKAMGQTHSALAAFETPNTERLWNDRLKAMEDELKPHTLWRAPHTTATVGLPSVNFDLNHTVQTKHGAAFIAMPRTLADHLVCQPSRLPSLACLMRLERQWSSHVTMDSAQRQSMLEGWSQHTPSAWSSSKALSTALGGAWVWRYNAVLEQLLKARTYGDDQLEQQSLDWLGEVSRLQARLGSLRMWKSGVWVALTGLLVAYFGNDWGTFTSTGSAMIAAASLGFGLVTNRVYWSKDPPPY